MQHLNLRIGEIPRDWPHVVNTYLQRHVDTITIYIEVCVQTMNCQSHVPSSSPKQSQFKCHMQNAEDIVMIYIDLYVCTYEHCSTVYHLFQKTSVNDHRAIFRICTPLITQKHEKCTFMTTNVISPGAVHI